MSYVLLKKATILSVVVFCVLLVVGSIQYAFSESVSTYVYKLISLSVAYTITLGFHFWSSSYLNTIGVQRTLLSLLNIEIILTLSILVSLVFNWFDFTKTIVVLSSLQLAHGAIYLCNMFLYDEEPIHKRTLSEQEILEKSHLSPINPATQESNGGNSEDYGTPHCQDQKRR